MKALFFFSLNKKSARTSKNQLPLALSTIFSKILDWLFKKTYKYKIIVHKTNFEYILQTNYDTLWQKDKLWHWFEPPHFLSLEGRFMY